VVPIAVTVFAVAITVPIVTVTLAITVPVVAAVLPVTAVVAVATIIAAAPIFVFGTTVTHVLARSWGMGSLSSRVIDTDPSTIKILISKLSQKNNQR
jgi:hypothetical protein